MLFSGENVSSVPGNLKRLAAARGKLAVNGGKVISGDGEWQDQIVFLSALYVSLRPLR